LTLKRRQITLNTKLAKKKGAQSADKKDEGCFVEYIKKGRRKNRREKKRARVVKSTRGKAAISTEGLRNQKKVEYISQSKITGASTIRGARREKMVAS